VAARLNSAYEAASIGPAQIASFALQVNMDPQQRSVAITFDQYRESYTQAVDDAVAFSGLKADFFTRVKARSLQDLAATRLGDTRGLRALDFGCGVGSYHTLLSPVFDSLTGVDVSTECVDHARKTYPSVRYETYDGDTLPFESGAFDIVFAIAVFHHIPPAQWTRSVEEMRRVLRPGGLAAIYEHNPLNPLTMHVVNSCPFDEDACLLRKSETRALLTAAGFSNIEARSILSVPPIGPIGRALDRALAWFPLGAQYFVAGRTPG